MSNDAKTEDESLAARNQAKIMEELHRKAEVPGGGLWDIRPDLDHAEWRAVMLGRLQALSEEELMAEAKRLIGEYWESRYWICFGGSGDAVVRAAWQLDLVLAAVGARHPQVKAWADEAAHKHDLRHAAADEEARQARGFAGHKQDQ